MYIRSKLQPDPMTDYVLEAEDGSVYIGRWLVGNTYEGWYIKQTVSGIEKTRGVYSQKELRITHYSNRLYIPKALMDDAFYGKGEISDFRETPEILKYVM